MSRLNDAQHSTYWAGAKYKSGSRFYKDDVQLKKAYYPPFCWLPPRLLWEYAKFQYHHSKGVDSCATAVLVLLGALFLVGVFFAGRLW